MNHLNQEVEPRTRKEPQVIHWVRCTPRKHPELQANPCVINPAIPSTQEELNKSIINVLGTEEAVFNILTHTVNVKRVVAIPALSDLYTGEGEMEVAISQGSNAIFVLDQLPNIPETCVTEGGSNKVILTESFIIVGSTSSTPCPKSVCLEFNVSNITLNLLQKHKEDKDLRRIRSQLIEYQNEQWEDLQRKRSENQK